MKQIKGFEQYTMDINGNIFSKKGKLLTISIDKYGYKIVHFYKDKKIWNMFVHRLIAINYIPNPNNYPIVNHIDGNKLNNSVDNLEWCTQRHNIMHSYAIGLKDYCIGANGEKNTNAILKNVDVIEIKKRLLNGEKPKEIVKDYNVKECTIRMIASGKRWKTVTI